MSSLRHGLTSVLVIFLTLLGAAPSSSSAGSSRIFGRYLQDYISYLDQCADLEPGHRCEAPEEPASEAVLSLWNMDLSNEDLSHEVAQFLFFFEEFLPRLTKEAKSDQVTRLMSQVRVAALAAALMRANPNLLVEVSNLIRKFRADTFLLITQNQTITRYLDEIRAFGKNSKTHGVPVSKMICDKFALSRQSSLLFKMELFHPVDWLGENRVDSESLRTQLSQLQAPLNLALLQRGLIPPAIKFNVLSDLLFRVLKSTDKANFEKVQTDKLEEDRISAIKERNQAVRYCYEVVESINSIL